MANIVIVLSITGIIIGVLSPIFIAWYMHILHKLGEIKRDIDECFSSAYFYTGRFNKKLKKCDVSDYKVIIKTFHRIKRDKKYIIDDVFKKINKIVDIICDIDVGAVEEEKEMSEEAHFLTDDTTYKMAEVNNMISSLDNYHNNWLKSPFRLILEKLTTEKIYFYPTQFNNFDNSSAKYNDLLYKFLNNRE